MLTIGIIGYGFVGKATNLFSCENIKTYIFDIDPTKCNPKGLTIKDMEKCNLIFICVPTPMQKNGKCFTNIVENVVNDLKKNISLNNTQLVIRSTIPIGMSELLDCFFMPEFLTEQNWENDFKNCENWIFGLKNNDLENKKFIENIEKLINTSFKQNKINHNKIIFLKSKEAEMLKYFRNTFLALKVSYCNEIEQFCKSKNIDYNNMKNIACLDNRIGLSHTNVPGPDGKRGFGGTCFPKDTQSLVYQMKEMNLESIILQSSLKRNEQIDRPEKEWERDEGRAFIH